MDTEIIATGRTYEEAVEKACAELGVDVENVDYEVLERPHTTFFGLKHVPAKVKVTLKEEYVAMLAKKAAAAEKRQQRENRPQREGRPQQKAQEPREKQGQKPQKDAAKKDMAPQKDVPKDAAKKEQRPPQPRQKKEQAPKKEQPAPQKAPPAKELPKEQPAAPEEVKTLDPAILESKGAAAAQYVRELLAAFGFPEAKVTVGQKDGMIALQLEGKGLGAVVGRRGDNLDAMQYLASLVANREDGSYCRVVLDVDDYRNKREASLQAYARKLASQAVRTGRSTTLEPMNPYERRIVHSAVQTVAGATSRSVGSEPNRRVVISAVSGGKAPQQPAAAENNRPERPKGEGGERRGRSGSRTGGRGGRGNRDRRDSQKVILPPSNEPPKIEEKDRPLYSKIELD